LGIARQTTATFVLQLTSGFTQKQAFRRRVEIQAAATPVACDVLVVFFWIVSEQTQSEPALARGRAVTSAGVATRFSQERQNRRPESDCLTGLDGGETKHQKQSEDE